MLNECIDLETERTRTALYDFLLNLTSIFKGLSCNRDFDRFAIKTDLKLHGKDALSLPSDLDPDPEEQINHYEHKKIKIDYFRKFLTAYMLRIDRDNIQVPTNTLVFRLFPEILLNFLSTEKEQDIIKETLYYFFLQTDLMVLD